MTDKELRKLKRSELLEILFYLRKELDELKTENQSLKERVDELTKAKTTVDLSEDSRSQLVQSFRSIVEDCLSGKAPPGRQDAPTNQQGGKSKKGKRQ